MSNRLSVFLFEVFVCCAVAWTQVTTATFAAFARVPISPVSRVPIRPGNAGHNAFRSPGSWTLDFSFGKNFAITERLNFQIRTDLFNALNHTNLGGPVTDIDNVNFGKIFGTGGARTVHVNARIGF